MAKITRQDAERLLGNVPEEYSFKVHGGGNIGSMKELGEVLPGMSEESYAFHANTEKNDFSNWVREVIHDDKLSRDLSKSHSKSQASKRTTERIVFLEEKLKV